MAFFLIYTLSPLLSYLITFCVCMSLSQLSYVYSYLWEKACEKLKFSNSQYNRNESGSPMISAGMLYLYKLSTTQYEFDTSIFQHTLNSSSFFNISHQDWIPLIIQRLSSSRFSPIWKMPILYKTVVKVERVRGRYKTQSLYPITVLWTLNWISEEKQLTFALSGTCQKETSTACDS